MRNTAVTHVTCPGDMLPRDIRIFTAWSAFDSHQAFCIVHWIAQIMAIKSTGHERRWACLLVIATVSVFPCKYRYYYLIKFIVLVRCQWRNGFMARFEWTWFGHVDQLCNSLASNDDQPWPVAFVTCLAVMNEIFHPVANHRPAYCNRRRSFDTQAPSQRIAAFNGKFIIEHIALRRVLCSFGRTLANAVGAKIERGILNLRNTLA